MNSKLKAKAKVVAVWFGSIAVFLGTPLWSQTPITGTTAAYDDVSDTSGDYSANGTGTGTFPSGTTFNMTFNVGMQNNLALSTMTTAAGTFNRQDLADFCAILRVDNANVTGDRELIFYERDSFVSPDLALRPTAVTAVGAMEAVLLNDTINRGSDNIFQNTGNGDGNNNNVERIDFVFSSGLTVPASALGQVGFLMLERGGNDSFEIAAITAIDGSNNPTTFGATVTVLVADWGASGFSVDTSVLRKDPADSDLRPSVNVFSQSVDGVFLSLSDLGIAGNQTFFGYSVFPADVAADLVGLTDAITTTDSAGGLDLMAGGAVYVQDTAVLVGDIEATKTDAIENDIDMDGFLDPGETLRYTVVVTNPGDGLNASSTGVIFTSSVDSNTALVVGSVTTNQGTVTTGNTGGDTTVAVNIGTVLDSDSVTITFDVLLDDPLMVGVTQISCQGFVNTDDLTDVPTDDPDTGTPIDPTDTSVPVELQSFSIE